MFETLNLLPIDLNDNVVKIMNCVQGRVVVDPSLEEEFAPTAEGHGEVEIFSFLWMGASAF
jgi:hypothetical protein